MKIHLPGGKTIQLTGKKWIVLEIEDQDERNSILKAFSHRTGSNLVGLYGDGCTDEGIQRILSKVEKK